MTGFDKPVSRVTVRGYAVTLYSAHPDPNGKKFVVELGRKGEEQDIISIRRQGDRKRVYYDVADLYRRGVKAGGLE